MWLRRTCIACAAAVVAFAGSSLTAPRAQDANSQTQATAGEYESADAKSPGTERMRKANEAASKVVKDQMQSERPEDAEVLEEVESAEIIVVDGQYDHVEKVLDAVDIEHLELTAAQLDEIELNAKQLLMINCPGQLSDEGIEKVRKFVKAGGYLYTTDWALKFVLERAFPGYVSFNDQETEDDVVGVDVAETDSAFLQHVELGEQQPKWWLEGSSYPIEIENDREVDVLIDSEEMAEKYGDAPIRSRGRGP